MTESTNITPSDNQSAVLKAVEDLGEKIASTNDRLDIIKARVIRIETETSKALNEYKKDVLSLEDVEQKFNLKIHRMGEKIKRSIEKVERKVIKMSADINRESTTKDKLEEKANEHSPGLNVMDKIKSAFRLIFIKDEEEQNLSKKIEGAFSQVHDKITNAVCLTIQEFSNSQYQLLKEMESYYKEIRYSIGLIRRDLKEMSVEQTEREEDKRKIDGPKGGGYSVSEAAKLSGLTTNQIYYLLRKGKLKTVPELSIGARNNCTVIAKDEIKKLKEIHKV